MAVDKKYNSICEKLGFIPSEYVPELSNTEDDTEDNPFSVLTLEESLYLLENGYYMKKEEQAGGENN